MSEVPVEEIGRIIPSLSEGEWEKLGGRSELSAEQLLEGLKETFGNDFPESLWRRHKNRIHQLNWAHHIINDAERERLGVDVPIGARMSQRLLELCSQAEIEDVHRRINEFREERRRAQMQARASSSEVSVKSYDFKHPARVNRDQLRTLENLHDNFARLLSSTLSGAMRKIVDVDTAFVDQTTYREYILSLSNPSCTYQFLLDPMQGSVVLDFAMPVVFGLVDRIHGGRGFSRGVEHRQMTQLEMGVMARVVKRALQDLEATWQPILPGNLIHDIELETNPEFMQITSAPEICILLAFEVNAPGLSGLISLCYPYFTLQSTLPRLGVQASPARAPGLSDERVREQNRLRLGGMSLPAVAEFGRTQIPAAAARTLEVGDVIRLDAHMEDPAQIFVGGQPKFLGYPCAVAGDTAAVEIAGRVPPQFSARYGTVDERERSPEAVLKSL
ncbi:MAG: hypothetical protein HOC05_15465 [Gemmatimonadetes bacterium]|nr:hypothetical protein [Gemmatimonadota bacterium]